MNKMHKCFKLIHQILRIYNLIILITFQLQIPHTSVQSDRRSMTNELSQIILFCLYIQTLKFDTQLCDATEYKPLKLLCRTFISELCVINIDAHLSNYIVFLVSLVWTFLSFTLILISSQTNEHNVWYATLLSVSSLELPNRWFSLWWVAYFCEWTLIVHCWMIFGPKISFHGNSVAPVGVIPPIPHIVIKNTTSLVCIDWIMIIFFKINFFKHRMIYDKIR